MAEHQGEGRTRPGPPTVHAARRARILGSLVILSLAVGCGAEKTATTADKPKRKPSAVAPAPPKVEKIAAMTGCKVNIRTEADELREGVCETSLGDYLVTTFPEEKYKLTWLDTARMYGGTYLVGPRWAISARPGVLAQLRSKVGGTIQELDGMNGAGPPTGSR
ncbi:hypothetical protein [Streptomyces sp. 8N706]|uniref:hypothetical protein n=1 Tax=Streptomyces sp. 8N706 TaxID=3457416 RepID=UPI003FD46727